MEHAANSNGEPDWNAVADIFCAAWSTDDGKPNFDVLAEMYAHDADVVIYDSLAPIEGFRGFEDLRSSIYADLAQLSVQRTGNVEHRSFADGKIVVTAYPLRFAYDFKDGRAYEFDARISEVWELRNQRYVIVHEHPSTVLPV